MTNPHAPDLSGTVALVTGASRGIGEAAARHLAACGAAVVLAARSERDIERIASEIAAAGGTASAVACDVADGASVEAAVRHAVETHGRLDALVNNAGLIEPIGRLAEIDPAAWAKVIDVNLKGVFLGLRHALPVMLEQGGGTIVNVSSGAAHRALEGWSHYCASKAGVLRLTEAAQVEYGDRGIRSLGMSPGTVATEMQRSIKRSGLNPVSELDWEAHIGPEWPARAIAFLLTPAADAWLGRDFTLKTPEERAAMGMPER
ncbi:SDR family NAD(P)-dependent oxidoreductase [Jannaschia sp. W003]|uniref:SDR family NAD(P)-dependent oxidoreductase n=1 Tax=Jannaschia sp. W003 TaxID=2867012 RepID=UPI0021A58BC1|nr:SDR family oxidoreductase [Jannaschia sp. W003]UWQ21500.1 SDR family oxidoreductase [Jannaschia sp. W003]